MIQELAYVGFASPKYEEWRTYGTGLLGCQMVDDGPDGAVRLRVDNVNYRIAIHPSEKDEFAYAGWGMANETDLRTFVEHLRGQGVTVTQGDEALAAEREVVEIYWFEDPWGNRHELVWGKLTIPNSFKSPRKMDGFVTGSQGLGHIVLIVPNLEEGSQFYADILGFRLSDRIKSDIFNLRFYHCNGRHHSIALAEVPGLTGFNHLMLEVANIDDLGATIDLLPEYDTDTLLSIGRHTNDLMISTYISTPSSLQIEYGYGGLVVDDLSWIARDYNHPSIWGHHRSERYMTAPPGIIRPVETAPVEASAEAPAEGSVDGQPQAEPVLQP
ncbi:VOC family protein [Salinibacterium sp. ZJ450]|uniref:VOC family protein n=1 Tax=Salinibacterium sp. ZJ450 TaxID=2708338 RepID=UPI00174AAB1C|nr:VOC family protein [Salinibacterium sp. ZJ450]